MEKVYSSESRMFGDVPLTAVSLPVFRTAFNYDMDHASDVSGLECEDPSLTQQSFKDECDINTIVRRFGLGMEVPENLHLPVSGDFVDAPDFQTAMNLVRRAEEEFGRVPADIRARFGNNPASFMAFLEDDANRDEAMRLGLLRVPEAPPVPLSVRVVPDEPK